MKLPIKNLCAFVFMLTATSGIIALSYAEASSDKASIEEVKQETRDLIEALKAYTVDNRDKAIQRTKAALDTLDKRIDALETRVSNNWEKMDKAAREKVRSSLQTLRKQRIIAAEWYGSLKSSSSDAWGHMKKGFLDAYKDLYEAWEKSEKEFGTDK